VDSKTKGLRLFTADSKLLQQLKPHLGRVLVVDHSPMAGWMIGNLMRTLGAREIFIEPDGPRALELADATDPNLIFVEYAGPQLDGESFTRRLRRSDYACRKAPVIMVTADATANIIKGARDAGVHEFLRKPFTSEDLIRRVQAVALKPRDWIEAVHYVGPDRRRFNSAEYAGKRKRRSDVARLDQSARILRSAISQFDTDPAQARRAIAEQAAFLKTAVVGAAASPRLTVAVAMLELSAGRDDATQATLAGLVKDVLDLFEANSPVKAA
jgi:two-component system, response regulator PdtaR